ncbi:transcriptional regulator [Providencia stuartii]|uniref:transcriptional regulator n=1 Tax=Providencia stuartii TaxID=588 RepID=UPI000CE667ED|nr:transcriptional regulator [Providencia stuartii]AVE40879.1 transcriptional regulator [Providencia stuartii]
MAQPSPRHDRLVHRLAYILTHLFKGETLSPRVLATEFNVSLRTIQRDFHERLVYLDIEQQEEGYRLAGGQSALRTDSDILQFAQITDITPLFPVLDRKLLSLLLSRHAQGSPYVVYNAPPKALPSVYGGFALITQAILDNQFIHYEIGGKTTHWVAPYKLTYFNGHWYVCGVMNGLIHAVELLHLRDVELSARHFKPDTALLQRMTERAFIQALPHFQYIKGILHPHQT